MEHIELFAGCGGLSLGLESAGFKLLFANELSPMAAETFAYNLLGEDLDRLAKDGGVAKKVCWLNSRYPADELKGRLRENPQLAPAFGEGYCEVAKDVAHLAGKLIVGSIRDLNKHLGSNKKLVKQLRDRNVDLVSGGPPCQSFSLAGLRQLSNDRNTLPMDFADFVGFVNPKIALLENVTGILRPFTLPDGKHYAWFEIARAFVSKGYVPVCLHVNAKYVGAAQNRPRFILLAIRKDVFDKLIIGLKADINVFSVFDKSSKFFKNEKSGNKTNPFVDLDYYDVEKFVPFFESGIFSSLSCFKSPDSWNTVKDAIDDLRENNRANAGRAKYPELLEKELGGVIRSKDKRGGFLNHGHRANSIIVQQRFRLYQHLGDADKAVARDVTAYLKDPDIHQLASKTVSYLLKKDFVSDDGNNINFPTSAKLLVYIKKLKTKKQTQRVLMADQPAPAALSIPDDACHYHKGLLRTLTVREMARFQSFPDWFEFRSKVTTGGKMRRFEVPQYTQVGNAVPPLLGKALGNVVVNILKKAKA